MTERKLSQWSVRPVVRWYVTHSYSIDREDGRCEGGSQSYGLFEHESIAQEVCATMDKAEQQREAGRLSKAAPSLADFPEAGATKCPRA